MGPNGAGKSTLAYVLGGRPGYEVTEGSVTFDGQDLLALEPHERAAAGLFLGFQYPVEIPGVSSLQFVRESLNTQRRARGEPDLRGAEFIKLAARRRRPSSAWTPRCSSARSMSAFRAARRSARKWSRWASSSPRLAMLDETDSGLDIDALRIVGAGINRIMRAPDKGVLLITHYQRLLDYVKPDRVHVLSTGRIVRSRRPRTRARAGARRLCGGGGMTAPFPTRKVKRIATPTSTRSSDRCGRACARPSGSKLLRSKMLQQIWLPSGEDVQVRARRNRARTGRELRAFSRSTPRREYGRIALDVTLARRRAISRFNAANIGGGEFDARNRHHRPPRRARRDRRARRCAAVLGGKATGSYLGKVAVARDAQQTDGEQSVKAMLLDRGATANCKPELEIYADDVKCAHGATVGELDADAIVLRRCRAGSTRRRREALLLEGFVAGLWDDVADEVDDADIAAAARAALRSDRMNVADPPQSARSTSAASSRRSPTGIISTAPPPRRSRRR